MHSKKVKIGEVKLNDSNPRSISEVNFNKLKKSIKEFPEMLELRPIIVDENMVALGGNMRLAACKELGLKEVFVHKVIGLTEEQKKEFIIKDNISFGEWDWDMIANEWSINDLTDWSLDLPFNTESFTPSYEPSIDTSMVTQEEINKKAKELANQMLHDYKSQQVMCPNCGNEFSIS
jgi:hypothetical protein